MFIVLQRAHTRVSVAGAKVIAWCCAGFMLHHTRMDTGCDDATKVLLRYKATSRKCCYGYKVTRNKRRLRHIHVKKGLIYPISPQIYSWLLDIKAFVYADKIRMLHSCGGATSTRVTQPPLSPLAMSLLSQCFVCLCMSIIMLNPRNTMREYKPFTAICLLFET